MNITRRDDEPGKLNLSFSVGVTHIVDEAELLEALAGAGVLEVEEGDIAIWGEYDTRGFRRQTVTERTRYVSQWEETK
jgi:hypothetical protein